MQAKKKEKKGKKKKEERKRIWNIEKILHRYLAFASLHHRVPFLFRIRALKLENKSALK